MKKVQDNAHGRQYIHRVVEKCSFVRKICYWEVMWWGGFYIVRAQTRHRTITCNLLRKTGFRQKNLVTFQFF